MMDSEEFLILTEPDHAPTTVIIAENISNSAISNKYVDPLFNKYAIIGALLLFACLFLISIFYYYFKADNNSCCKDEHGRHLYDTLSDDDAKSFTEDDDASSELYVSCQLLLDDPEVNAASGLEYDCRSLDGTSIEIERTLLINQKQWRYETFH